MKTLVKREKGKRNKTKKILKETRKMLSSMTDSLLSYPSSTLQKSRKNKKSEDEKEEENEELKQATLESRRLARLFGSKMVVKRKSLQPIQQDLTKTTKNEKQTKHENNNDEMIHRLSKPKYTTTKFIHRRHSEGTMNEEMHADNNYQIEKPWFVGYRNSTSIPAGSLLAIAKR